MTAQAINTPADAATRRLTEPALRRWLVAGGVAALLLVLLSGAVLAWALWAAPPGAAPAVSRGPALAPALLSLGALWLVLAGLLVQLVWQSRLALQRLGDDLAAETAARRGSDRLCRSLVAAVPDALVVQSGEGVVVEHNAAARSLLGLADVEGAAAPQPMPWVRFDDLDGLPLHTADTPAARALATGQPQRDVLLSLRRAGGAAAWVLVNAEPVATADGHPPFKVVLALTDVTSRQMAPRIQQDPAPGLQPPGGSPATAGAADDGLVPQATLAHELRTPLNAILGIATLLGQPQVTLSPTHRRQLGVIADAARGMLALVNRLLTLAQQPGLQRAAQAVALDLRAGVQAVVDLLALQAEQAGLQLLQQWPDTEPWFVRVDPLQLRQVLVNLLSNAVKYNRPGGRVMVTVRAAGAGYCTLAVSDTGRGFTPEQQARLFQPYLRFESPGSAVPGAGIGLVITQRLVQAMGGTLALTTQAGVGSTFSFDLPRVAPPAGGPA